MDKKHFVLTFMNRSQDHLAETHAEYKGEYPVDRATAGEWIGDCLIIPNWFDTEEQAREYVAHVEERTLRTYYMVQERHYPKEDPRTVHAKILLTLQNDFYPQPDRGQTQETADGPVIDVWTMYFYSLTAAQQHVKAVNDSAVPPRSA